MSYALIDIVAILVVFIINYTMIFGDYKPKSKKAFLLYRLYLLALVVYFAVDASWGLVASFHSQAALIADSSIYFFLMIIAMLSWTHFEVEYLNENNIFGIVLKILGWALFAVGVALVITNIFHPIMFSVDENGVYQALLARDIFMLVQVFGFLATGVFAIISSLKKSKEDKIRHIAIAAVGIEMGVAVFAQYFSTELPLYSAGLLLGCCILYMSVVRLETNEYKRVIELGKQELGVTKELAYHDSLTGTKNKHAYVEKEEEMNIFIREKKVAEFSIILFDLNDLKAINDTYGHDVGDKYIIKTCEMINSYFNGDEIYRFGGDEFVLILEGESYSKRYKVLEKFDAMIEKNVGTKEPIVATGIADFNPKNDNTLRAVFVRADQKMYMRKRSLKEMSNG